MNDTVFQWLGLLAGLVLATSGFLQMKAAVADNSKHGAGCEWNLWEKVIGKRKVARARNAIWGPVNLLTGMTVIVAYATKLFP